MLAASLRLLAIGLAVSIGAAPCGASTRVGIYAIVDAVIFEPSDIDPDRIVIWGTFVVPTPISSGEHERTAAGILYFSLNPDAPVATRTDWRALREVSGTGKVVGFGEYWMPCSRAHFSATPPTGWLPANSNCSFEVNVFDDRTRATAEPYPVPSTEGVVTVFDQQDDVCPRFGRASVEIVGELLAAHSPGIAEYERPMCNQTLGLVASSDLERTFPTQTRDVEWAGVVEAQVLRLLTQARGLALSALDVECRETICQIRLAFPSREYQEATGSRLAADALQELTGKFAQGAAIVPSETDAAVVYYVQRRKPSLADAAASAQH